MYKVIRLNKDGTTECPLITTSLKAATVYAADKRQFTKKGAVETFVVDTKDETGTKIFCRKREHYDKRSTV